MLGGSAGAVVAVVDRVSQRSFLGRRLVRRQIVIDIAHLQGRAGFTVLTTINMHAEFGLVNPETSSAIKN